MSELTTEIVENVPTPEQLHVGHEDDECHRTPLAHFSSGNVTGTVERLDWWSSDGLESPSLIEATVDYPGNRIGIADIEVIETDPVTITSLPDIAAVVTAVHSFICEWIARREGGDTQ